MESVGNLKPESASGRGIEGEKRSWISARFSTITKLIVFSIRYEYQCSKNKFDT